MTPDRFPLEDASSLRRHAAELHRIRREADQRNASEPTRTTRIIRRRQVA